MPFWSGEVPIHQNAERNAERIEPAGERVQARDEIAAGGEARRERDCESVVPGGGADREGEPAEEQAEQREPERRPATTWPAERPRSKIGFRTIDRDARARANRDDLGATATPFASTAARRRTG